MSALPLQPFMTHQGGHQLSMVNLQGSSENGGGVMLPEDVVAAQLETVLYAQMLILFAPQASSLDRHLPLLMSCLASRQPALRQAAASTLHHLAGGDSMPDEPATFQVSLACLRHFEDSSRASG